METATSGRSSRHQLSTFPADDSLQKRWEMQENWRKDVWHGSETRPTMYFANMDLKTVPDAARPKIHREHLGRVGDAWVDFSSSYSSFAVCERADNLRTCRMQFKLRKMHSPRQCRSANVLAQHGQAYLCRMWMRAGRKKGWAYPC